jgi:hypothetical protein
MKNDRPGLEKDETVLLEHRYLAEGLQGSVVGLILIAHFQETGAVRQPRFLQRPADAEVAHLPASKIGDPPES